MRGTNSSRYRAGWLLTTEPDEDLITLSEHAWSEIFLGMTSKRVYKVVKKTKDWYRFAWVATRPDGVGFATHEEH